MFCYFALEECVILAPRQGIELVTPALEGEVLTTGLQGISQEKSFKFQFYVLLSQNILHYFFLLLWELLKVSYYEKTFKRDRKEY